MATNLEIKGGTGSEADPDNATAEAIDFSRFEGIGITGRVAWLASAFLYGSGGILFTVMTFLSTAIPNRLAIFSISAIVIAVICIVGANRYPDAHWAAHVRSTLGMLIIGGGALVIGNVHSATCMVMLYPILVTAYMYDLRHSLPYVIVGTTWFIITLAMIDDPTAHAIVSGTIMAALSSAIIFSQQELREIVAINRDLSITDPLTGVSNVRHLQHALREAVAFDRDSQTVALFGLDLDNFKLVNDQFSHTRGDEVLKAVAAEIGEELLPSDMIARRGGDEFSVLVTDLQGRDLEALRNAIASAIARARRRTCPQVTTSGSVAYVVHQQGETVDQLFERCDRGLHEAKLDAHPERRQDDGVVLIGRFANRQRNAQRTDHLVRGNDDAFAEELQMARSIRHALGTASAWNIIAVMNLAAALAILGALATTTGADLASRIPVIGAIGLLIQGGVAMYAAKRHAPSQLMHFPLLAMTVLITAVEWQAGPLRASLADLYLLPIVAAFYAIDAKRVLPYLVGNLVLFGVMLVTANYPYTVARICITGVITLAMVGLLAKARRVTREFTTHAVDLSTVDALTGIANLRGMRRAVTTSIDRCTATGELLALITVDLDDFKQVNDRHSHTLGDKVLVAVAGVMGDSVRKSDVVARRGGDEFAIVCVVENELEILPLITRVSEAITSIRSMMVADVTPTASIGSVVWMPNESAETFLARADEELHGAKAQSHEARAESHLRLA